jgi:hypothetical protein
MAASPGLGGLAGGGPIRAVDLRRTATSTISDAAVVTENVADFAADRDVVLAFVLKKNLPPGRAQTAALASVLDRWAHEHPEPYVGQHCPRASPTAWPIRARAAGAGTTRK